MKGRPVADDAPSEEAPAIQPPTKTVPSVEFPSWEDFEVRLSGVLAAMAVRTYLIISVPPMDDESVRYVQFGQGGRSGFLAEAASNEFLVGRSALSPQQEQQMGDVGWMWPTPGSRTDRHFSRQWPMPAPFDEIARLAVRTLRDVYGVEDTSELTYKSYSQDHHFFVQPSLGINAEPPAAPRPTAQPAVPTMDDLRPVVERAIRHLVHGHPVEYDERGDIPIQMGSVTVFLRLVDASPPILQIFSPVLWGIAGSGDLLEAVNNVNTRARFGRVAWTGREVMATGEVPAARITADDIAFACLQVGSIADHFGGELRERFGGATMSRLRPGRMN
jgi:hypothetical protein